ncbi:MAG: hypothetical protein IKQ15_10455 [Kiritimatiellae bacterium]|nr:hypothetical protein [Kiritimatiellia bacterium]
MNSAPKTDNGDTIEALVEKEDWENARKAILEELETNPDSHYLVTRLALTYYEQRQYETALHYSQESMKLAPRCPLVLWNYAGALEQTGHECEAIRIWKSLLRRGVERIAHGPCGEGIRQAESLLNDCRYRIGKTYYFLGRHALAWHYMHAHLRHRRRGLPSIYSRTDVLWNLKRIAQSRNKR